jgi:transposase
VDESQLKMFDILPEVTIFDHLTREELIQRINIQAEVQALMKKAIEDLSALANLKSQEHLSIKDQLVIVKNKLFGASSEKRPSSDDIEKSQSENLGQTKRSKDPRVLLPSLRYPTIPLQESHVAFEDGKEPCCKLCAGALKPMNDQTENSEWISVTQKVYYIKRSLRQKYRCENCHGDVQTAPLIPRIKPGSAFSDEIAIDVAIAKYADHLPVERYVNQAERQGLKGVSHQSLIEQTHYLADFLTPVYLKLKASIQNAKVIQADETHWKMLEGSDKKRWQLWGFFDAKTAYYEAHDTRAAAVAEAFLKNCKAQYLVSDAYAGYTKCTKNTEIKNVFCNAHARRKWCEAEDRFKDEVKPMLDWYQDLAAIEKEIKGLTDVEKVAVREKRSKPIFEQMKSYCERLFTLPKSSLGVAQAYFLNYYAQLTEFLNDGSLPIDNNLSERSLRGPVVGRKNFYGNHSLRGAETMQILYSIIETCKLNGVEPFKYLKDVVVAIHRGSDSVTPSQYALI